MSKIGLLVQDSEYATHVEIEVACVRQRGERRVER
jgi:hypothetical protein